MPDTDFTEFVFKWNEAFVFILTKYFLAPLFEVVVSCAVVCDVVVLVDVVSELDMEVSVLVSEVSLPEVDEVNSAEHAAEEKLREIAGDSQAYFNDSAGYYSAEQFFQDSAELPEILFRDDVQEIGLALIYDYDVNLIQWLVLTEA